MVDAMGEHGSQSRHKRPFVETSPPPDESRCVIDGAACDQALEQLPPFLASAAPPAIEVRGWRPLPAH